MLSCSYSGDHLPIKLGDDASEISNARRPMTNTKQREDMISKLERGFNPRNIAVVGAARHNEFRWLKSHLAIREHNGDVFHVNIDENEWISPWGLINSGQLEGDYNELLISLENYIRSNYDEDESGMEEAILNYENSLYKISSTIPSSALRL